MCRADPCIAEIWAAVFIHAVSKTFDVFCAVSIYIRKDFRGIRHLQWLKIQGVSHQYNKISTIFMLDALWYNFAPSPFSSSRCQQTAPRRQGTPPCGHEHIVGLRTSDCLRHAEYACGLDGREKMDMNNRDAMIMQRRSISVPLFPRSSEDAQIKWYKNKINIIWKVMEALRFYVFGHWSWQSHPEWDRAIIWIAAAPKRLSTEIGRFEQKKKRVCEVLIFLDSMIRMKDKSPLFSYLLPYPLFRLFVVFTLFQSCPQGLLNKYILLWCCQ